MLNDVAGSIVFSLASPDPLTSITGAQGEPALICEKHRAPVADMPILVFYSKCKSSSMVLGSEHRAHYRTLRPEATLMKSVSDCVGRDIHSSSLLEVIL